MSAEIGAAESQSAMPQPSGRWAIRRERRRRVGTAWQVVFLGATLSGIVLLALLLWSVLQTGVPWLSWHLITNAASEINPEIAGVWPAIVGSFWLVVGAGVFAFVIGVGTSIYLEEYAPATRWTRLLQVNISNLAGVPSIVYGLLGLVLFVQWMGMGRSILAGALTLGLLILPIVVVASQEAIRAVPPSIRQAAYGVGATQWQVVRSHVLPAAFPGILTGMILSVSRAMGETAPLIVVGAATFYLHSPSGPLSSYTALPMQIYYWATRPQAEFEHLTAAAIIVLLVILLAMNGLAIYIRHRLSTRNRW